MSLLTINAGSSSLKLALYEMPGLTRKSTLLVERIGSTGTRLLITGSSGTTEHKVDVKDHAGGLDQMFRHLPELFASGLRAVGHRIVHGGLNHANPEPITAGLLNDLQKIEHLDPTHLPQSLTVSKLLLGAFPMCRSSPVSIRHFTGQCPRLRNATRFRSGRPRLAFVDTVSTGCPPNRS